MPSFECGGGLILLDSRVVSAGPFDSPDSTLVGHFGRGEPSLGEAVFDVVTGERWIDKFHVTWVSILLFTAVLQSND